MKVQKKCFWTINFYGLFVFLTEVNSIGSINWFSCSGTRDQAKPCSSHVNIMHMFRMPQMTNTTTNNHEACGVDTELKSSRANTLITCNKQYKLLMKMDNGLISEKAYS